MDGETETKPSGPWHLMKGALLWNAPNFESLFELKIFNKELDTKSHNLWSASVEKTSLLIPPSPFQSQQWHLMKISHLCVPSYKASNLLIAKILSLLRANDFIVFSFVLSSIFYHLINNRNQIRCVDIKCKPWKIFQEHLYQWNWNPQSQNWLFHKKPKNASFPI